MLAAGGYFLRVRRASIAAAAVAAIALSACGLLPDAVVAPGARQWIITVENQSNQPARLSVAEDGPGPGQLVGTADPAVVPPGATQDVVFTVPQGGGWAIFVNPVPGLGPLILERDVPPGQSGDLPLTIFVNPDGSSSVSAPGEPGWFGN
jgi:hypothetical protein